LYKDSEPGEALATANVLIYPIVPLFKSLETVSSITLNRDRDETEDLLEDLKYFFYEGFNDEACTDTLINSYYADELEGNDKYEIPQINLTYDKTNAYFTLEDFVVGTDQTKKYKEVDTPDILRMEIEPKGDFPGLVQDIEVYVTPVKYLIRELSLPILTVEKGEKLDLLDKLIFRVVSGYYRLASRMVFDEETKEEREELYWVPCAKNVEAEQRIEVSELPEPSEELSTTVYHLIKNIKATDDEFFAPEVTWSGFDDNGTINNGIFSATTTTSILGVKVSAKIDSQVYDTHVVGAKVTSTLFVTPFSVLLSAISFPEELSYIDLAKGETIDISDYVLYTFVQENGETGEPVKVTYTKEELEAANIPVPELTVSSSYVVSVEGSRITGVSTTDINGVSITVKDSSNSKISASVIIRVTPLAYEVKCITIDSPLTVDINETLDLSDKVKFIVVTDAEGTEAEKSLTDEDWTAPTLEWSENEEYYKVSYKNILTPKKRTLASGVSDLQVTIRSSIYQEGGERVLSLSSNTATLQITPLISPLTSLKLVPSSEKAVVGGDAIVLTVEISPEDGEYDEENLSIYSDYGTIEKTEAGWAFTATKVGAAEITFSYEDENSSVSGSISIQNGYKYELAKGWNWTSYFMLAKDGYTVTAFDQILGGTSENHRIQDIRSQEDVASVDPTQGYFGSLTDIIYNNMYKVKMSGDGSFDEFDYSLYKTSETPATTLGSGWTWVAYPYQYSHTIDQLNEAGAFEAFTADVQIVTLEDNFVQYTKEDKSWSTTEFAFRPGQGYMIFTEESTTINWPAESTLGEDHSEEYMAPSARKSSNLNYDVHAFRDVMPVIASLKNIPDLDDISIGAFVNGECRGEGYAATVCGEQKLFITIHGQAGDVVTFKGYDGMDTFDISGKVEFANQAGTVQKPVELTADNTSGIFEIDNDENAVVIKDLTGRVVSANISQLPAGTYIITDGKTSKVIVK